MFLGAIPRPIRDIIYRYIRAGMSNWLWEYGLSRHSWEDLHDLAVADIDALATFLGKQYYFLGDEPTEADCIVFGLLDGLLYYDILEAETRFVQHLRTKRNLVEYTKRMRSLAFVLND